MPHIESYYRRDGTYVRSHYRAPAGGGYASSSDDYDSDCDDLGGFEDGPWNLMFAPRGPTGFGGCSPVPPPEPQIVYVERPVYLPAPAPVAPAPVPVHTAPSAAQSRADVAGLVDALSGLNTRDRRPPGLDSGILSADLLQRLRTSGHIILFSDIGYNPEDDLVGEGSFGAVYKATWQTAAVALKKLRFQNITRHQLQDFTNEIRVLAAARHPHVVQFLGACVERPNLAVVTEFLGGGSLWDALHVLDVSTDWSREKRLDILRQACSGLLYLHHLGVTHRDVKSANLLLSADVTTCKVADFGLGRVRSGSAISSTRGGPRVIGTLLWAAPEILEGGTVDRNGYEEGGRVQLRGRLLRGERPNLPADLAPDVRSAIERAWDKDPARRPTTMGQLYCVLNGEPIPDTPGNSEPGTRSAVPATQRQRRCIVCLEGSPSAMVRPCRHTVTCQDCVLKIMERTGDGEAKCPVCRAAISDYVIGSYNESLVR
ncbi:Putative zinc finger containing protein kinase [Klebsormidium nitens]|uniref:Putative zinc finger containing protein kinase n=1 Tax=Klebsormidium nitens TaxID=105231 RepID=A0A1Y1HLE9_KLENI|nr:Putative zinc finger containing protein kinase [Klebsormidium nitens]|eukprot:GAQ78482.1 Putative zinc finger containing protein kinase [Klebsormidium nitens]